MFFLVVYDEIHSVETCHGKILCAHKRSMKGGNPTKMHTNLIKILQCGHLGSYDQKKKNKSGCKKSRQIDKQSILK